MINLSFNHANYSFASACFLCFRLKNAPKPTATPLPIIVAGSGTEAGVTTDKVNSKELNAIAVCPGSRVNPIVLAIGNRGYTNQVRLRGLK